MQPSLIRSLQWLGDRSRIYSYYYWFGINSLSRSLLRWRSDIKLCDVGEYRERPLSPKFMDEYGSCSKQWWNQYKCSANIYSFELLLDHFSTSWGRIQWYLLEQGRRRRYASIQRTRYQIDHSLSLLGRRRRSTLLWSWKYRKSLGYDNSCDNCTTQIEFLLYIQRSGTKLCSCFRSRSHFGAHVLSSATTALQLLLQTNHICWI